MVRVIRQGRCSVFHGIELHVQLRAYLKSYALQLSMLTSCGSTGLRGGLLSSCVTCVTF